MSFFEAVILGIIQGLTEFLPVSSSGHIELGKAILGIELSDPLLLSIVLHLTVGPWRICNKIDVCNLDVWTCYVQSLCFLFRRLFECVKFII